MSQVNSLIRRLEVVAQETTDGKSKKQDAQGKNYGWQKDDGK